MNRYYIERLTTVGRTGINKIQPSWAIRDRQAPNDPPVERRETRARARVCCAYWNAMEKRQTQPLQPTDEAQP